MLEPTLGKGEEIFLDIKDSARRRVLCGLRWDPIDENDKEIKSRDISLQGASTQEHDLDLLCLTFDKRGRFIEAVTGDEGHRTGDTGNIYHTGDVVDGEDELDDEQLSMELFNLSMDIHQIFFIAEVQSAHTFGMISGGEIRIARAIEDTNFAHAYLGRYAGQDKSSFIFGCLYRVSQGWNFKYIGEYMNGADVSDWANALNPYLEVAKDRDGKPVEGPPEPKKGETVPLHYSQTARQRVICGLNWDPLSENPGLVEKLKNKGRDTSGFDLDLACVMYGEDNEAVDGVSAQPDENMDASGKIYHSGDDTSGEGDRVDDEAISIELKDLPEYIHHIVFIAEIQSNHTFEDIVRPSMRVADGKTDEDQLLSHLNAREFAENCTGKNGFVFARMTREDGKWTLTNIGEFFNGEDVEDIIEYLKRYLA